MAKRKSCYWLATHKHPDDLSYREMYCALPETSRGWIREHTKPGQRRENTILESYQCWEDEVLVDWADFQQEMKRDDR